MFSRSFSVQVEIRYFCKLQNKEPNKVKCANTSKRHKFLGLSIMTCVGIISIQVYVWCTFGNIHNYFKI